MLNRRQFVKTGVAAFVTRFSVAALRGQTPPAGRQPLPLPPLGPDGWAPLFNGRNLDGWYSFLQRSGKNSDPSGSLRVDNGMLHILGNSVAGTGVESGYMAFNQEFSDYCVRLEYKWGTARFPPRLHAKRDNGLLIHLTGPDRVWPTCMEFQIQESDVGDAIPLNGVRDIGSGPGNGLAPWPNAPTGANAVSSTERRAYRLGDFENRDDWNVVEAFVRGDKAAFLVNGRIVNSVFNMQRPDPPLNPAAGGQGQAGPPPPPPASTNFVPLDRGKIGIEVEYAEIWYRKIAIRPLTDSD